MYRRLEGEDLSGRQLTEEERAVDGEGGLKDFF